jgi:multiple sugar transport system ATP-binding protein
MNMFDAKLVKKEGKYFVNLAGYEVELSADKQARLVANNVEEQDITLGVRPEHLSLVDNGVDAKIDVHELMGSSVHLHVNTMGKDIIVIVSTMDMTAAEVNALSAGVAVKIGFGGNVCHVFSKETGINLEA